ncbi:hypothetical protein HYPBUDRAFT_139606 [Hyphopichia burtonii NRRL Y-1933]|uniref:Uncharacterized protein n=1 Tax=Hyphopichia burtonii NRRL Y-1933 TaxID=984485 RepID=A0A1E4RIQ1_9ASCO|nr:hypothetical protein HYPBUDRAFT_139606 [Hyphopichia burtonii NRRL Y-1933]ODV67111.1 hypothetical protein HYPBUDRAFT_139606 [Hyphopichia burtonii NRRL Y-1933]
MAPLKKPLPRKREDENTKDRAIKAASVTALSLLFLLLWGYQALWAIGVIFDNRFGSLVNNLVFGIGSLIASGGIAIKVVTYLNDRLLTDTIDADHKKYI